MARLRLGDIGKVSMCKRVLKHETLPEGDIPFYKISTFGGRADVFIARELYDNYRLKYSYPKCGDILISAAGTVGKTVVYNGSPAYFQDSNIVWIANNEKVVLNRYLYYFYKTEPWRTTNGSTISRIYNENLRDIEIDVPSLNTQSKIASVLEKLDEKIDINNKINAELEATARDLYNYWFVQFEFPDDNQRPYKTAGGAMVYNLDMNREIPESWTVSELGKTLKTVLGGTPSTKIVDYWHPGDIPWVSSGEVSELPVTKTLVNITESGLKNSAAYLLPRYTVLISIVRHIRVSFLTTEATTNQSVVGIIESDKIKLPFIYLSALNDVPRLLSRRTGAQQPHINKDEVDSSPIVVSDDETLRAFNEITIPIFKQIESLAKQRLDLEELRNQLLPLLMTGQVSVD
jgi:type I restriction enzyme S subunit